MKKFVIAAFVSLAVVAGAAAAWVIYNPAASGGATGTFATVTHQNMITFAAGTGSSTPVSPCTAGTGATCTGGDPGIIPVAVTNNDPAAAHAASGVTITFQFAPSGCYAHLFVTGTSNLTETVAPGATNQDATITYVADPSTPASCSSVPVTATITGTAS